MSALPTRSDLSGTPSKSTLQTLLLGIYDVVAQRLAAGTTGAGTASAAELKTARDSLGLGAGADIASAATLDLTARTGNLVRITGTTATSAVTLNNGDQVTCYAVGAWPLTYHATNNPLPGGVDYACAAGDLVTFSKNGSGTISVAIARKSGEAIWGVPVGAIMDFPMSGPSAGYLVADGSSGYGASVYAALFAYLVKQSVVTVSIASPGVITWPNHPLSANDPFKFATTGSLLTGFVAGTQYYVVGASITTNTFQLSATPGGAAINTSGTQSGVHTGISAPYGVNSGLTTFGLPDYRGVVRRGLDRGAGIDPNRSIGSLQLDAMQGHLHSVDATNGSNAGYSGRTDSNQDTHITNTGSPISDGTNGTPRTASETRMINMPVLTCIKY